MKPRFAVHSANSRAGNQAQSAAAAARRCLVTIAEREYTQPGSRRPHVRMSGRTDRRVLDPNHTRTRPPMGRIERSRELARRRHRRVKVKKLRTRYAKADSRSEKLAILHKARRLSPFIDLETPAPAAAPE